MNNVPRKLRKELASSVEYKMCALTGYHICGGRITWEHSIIHAGRQVQTRWAIVPLCARGHEVDEYQDAHTMDKEMNVWVALNRASDAELASISGAIDYLYMRHRLNAKYGVYKPPFTYISGSHVDLLDAAHAINY